MRRCVICDHGLREFINFEPDYENEPYYFVDVCFECAKHICNKLNAVMRERNEY